MAEPFGKYLLLEQLAVGGMGEVHLAKAGTPGFERFFAIKRILTQRRTSKQFAEMLMNEARITIGLNHPNIAQVFEFGNLEGHFFLVMEYVEGLSMRHVLEAGQTGPRLSPADAVYVAIQICRALAYAHEHRDTRGQPLGIIHRDVSPHNILIDRSGSVKLIDFGVAKAASNFQETQTGTIKGKIGYMSPEQAKGLKVDRRSDIYTVGVVLFEALGYQRMFSGDTVVARLHQLQTRETPELDPQVAASLPATLRDALDRALAFDADDRYPTAADMERDLARALGEIDDAHTPHELAELIRRLDTGRDARRQRFQQYEEISAESIAPTLIAGRKKPPPPPAVEVSEPKAEREPEPEDDLEAVDEGPTPGSGLRQALVGDAPAPRPTAPRRGKRRGALLALAGTIVGLGAIAVATQAKWMPRAEPIIGRFFPSLVPSWKPPEPESEEPAVAPEPEPVLRRVDVRTRPRRAQVFIDGELRGVTPLLLEDIDASGSHLVRIERPGFAPYLRVLLPAEKPVEIKVGLRRARRGKRKAKAIEVPPEVGAEELEEADEELVESTDIGCVAIEAEPPARVEVDGQVIGETPIECVSLAAGRHRVVLHNDELHVDKQIEVEVMAGQTTTLSESLVEDP